MVTGTDIIYLFILAYFLFRWPDKKYTKKDPVLISEQTVSRVRSFTGMDIITGMDYRNGHYVVELGV